MHLLIFSILSFVAISSWAQTTKFSNRHAGVQVQIGSLRDGGVLESTDKIRYSFLTTNQLGTKVAYLKPEFFLRVHLSAEAGQEIKLRKKYANYGKRFQDATNSSADKIEWTSRGGSDMPHVHVERLRVASAAAKELPSPEELFELPAPGRYMLGLEFQVFEQVSKGTNITYKLIRIPAIHIPVIDLQQRKSVTYRGTDR